MKAGQGKAASSRSNHNLWIGIALILVGMFVAISGGAAPTVAVLLIVGAGMLGVRIDWPTLL